MIIGTRCAAKSRAKINGRKASIFALSAAAFLACATSRADQFNRTASGDWGTTNWFDVNGFNPNFPNGGDDAAINGGYSVTISTDSPSINDLYVGYLFPNGNSNPQVSTAAFVTMTENFSINGQLYVDSGSIFTVSGSGGGYLNNEYDSPGQQISIGSAGTASTFIINNQGEVDAQQFHVQNGSTVTIDSGDLELQGNISLSQASMMTIKNGGGINATGALNIGDDGTGTLFVQSAAHVLAAQLSVDSGSSATIDGINSIVSVPTAFGGGNITIQNGGNLSDNAAVIAGGSTLTVTGSLSSWTSGGGIIVGHSVYGSAHLSVQSGGAAVAASVLCDFGSSILVSGSGSLGGASSLAVTGNLYAGYSSAGNSLTVNSGGYASDLNGFVGYLNGSSATVLVTDSGSLWNNTLGLYINAGSFTVQSGGQVTASSASAASSTTVHINSGGNLTVSGTFINNAALSLAGSATLGSLTGTGSIANTGSLTFKPSGGGSLANTMTGGGSLIVNGNGTLTVTSSNPSYTGSVKINSGTLRIGNSSALGSGAVNISVPGTLDLNANSLALSGLAGGGIIDNLTGGTVNLTVSTTGNPIYFGSIQNTAGSLGLIVSGNGTLTLYGTNSYSGTTTINAGATLAIDTPASLPINAIIVNNGVLHINANGATTVASPITGGGSVVMASTGSLTLAALPAGGTTLTAGTTILQSAASNHTLINVSNSAFTFAGGKLNLTNHDMLITGGSAQRSAAELALVAPALVTLGNATQVYMTTSLESGADYRANTGSSSFDSAAVLNGDLVLRYGLAGDVIGSGAINMDDYLALDDGFREGLSGYAHGDFNHDGVINAADYALIDFNYLHQSGPLADGMISEHTQEFGTAYTGALLALTPQPVPEPASLALLALGMQTILSRRRHKRPGGSNRPLPS